MNKLSAKCREPDPDEKEVDPINLCCEHGVPVYDLCEDCWVERLERIRELPF